MDTALSVVSPPAPAPTEPVALPPWDLLVGGLAAAMAALLPIAISAATASQTFTPKYALLVVLTGAGLVPLVRLAWASRVAWQAHAAVAFVIVGVISAALSPSKLVGFFGLYDWGEGAVFLAGLAAAWAIGVSLNTRTRNWLVVGLLVGSTANAVAAVVQSAASLNTQQADLAGFGLFNGTQADGMMGNPIHLEAILLGGMALLVGPLCRSKGRRTLLLGALVALHAAALECSSERYAIALLVVLLVAAAIVYRLRAGGYVAATVVGFAGAFLGGGGASLSNRVATSTAATTYKLRLHAAYSGSLATLLHRPFLGFGPGEVRNALALYQSRSFATQLGAGRFFTDLHDIFANMLVMTGIVGFAFFVAWFVGSAYGARGALAGFAAMVLAVELAEPMNVGITPLAFLALGAALGVSSGNPWTAQRRRSADSGAPPGGRALALAVVLGVLALVPAFVLVAGDYELHNANMTFSLAAASDANRLLPIWPETADEVAQVYAYQSIVDLPDKQSALTASRDWAATAASRDPSDEVNWALVTAADLQLRDDTGAYAAGLRAVADCQYCTAALTALGTSAGALADWPVAVAEYRAAVAVEPGSKVIAQGLHAALTHDRSFFQSSGE